MDYNVECAKKSNKRKKITSIILAILIVLLSFVGGTMVGIAVSSKNMGLIAQVTDIINSTSYIVDPSTGEVREFTQEDYVKAIANAIYDNYAKYYSPEEFITVSMQDSGNYKGLGFQTYSNSKKIFKVIGNSPADLAGIKAGAVLVGAKTPNEQKVQFDTVKDINDYFEANKNQSVFTLYFEDGKEYVLTQKEYEVSYVTYIDNKNKLCFRTNEQGVLQKHIQSCDEMSDFDDQTAYLKYDLFEGDSVEQFATALEYMFECGRTKLILDLRNNGGGKLNILSKIASYLIYNQGKKSSLVLKTEEKSGSTNYYTNSNNFDDRMQNIVVLANENTASASEALIGAMLHYGDKFAKNRDNLVIEKSANGVAKTYGKGIMQTTYLLNNGGAFRLTTGRVIWPDEQTCIHGTGIVVTGENAVEKGYAVQRAMEII